MALTTVVSLEFKAAATSLWGSGRNQLRVPPWFTPSRSPEGATIESVLVVVGELKVLIRATVSVVPT
jgi:hypothetical protein